MDTINTSNQYVTIATVGTVSTTNAIANGMLQLIIVTQLEMIY